MNVLKKLFAPFVAAVCGGVALLPQVSSVATPAASTALAALALTAVTPSVANAQSGKRTCGRIWFLKGSAFKSNAALSFVMEVYKWDVFTCTALQVVYTVTTALPTGIMGWAQTMFGIGANPNTGAQGTPVYMATCEWYSSKMKLSTSDVCLQMQDYKFYGIVNVGGSNWAMKKF